MNVALGTAVVAVGFWLLWGTASPAIVLSWIAAVAGFLWWTARTGTDVWAWSTLLLGLESFAWPVVLMVQLKGSGPAPSEEEMGTVLSAVVLGLFSSVFWVSFSYGLFKRSRGGTPEGRAENGPEPERRPEPIKNRKRR